MVAGVLLPTSTTHPLIPHDFMAGIRASLKHTEASVTLVPGYVGFGASADVVKAEAEKLLLEHDPEVIIAFVDHPIADTLFPLTAQLNKLLIVVNSGAKYAVDWKAPAHVYFHTLENAYLSYLTAGYASRQANKAMMATSYYDGGYSLCHALTQPFINGGGKILYNFAGSFKLAEFNTSPMADFISANSDVRAVMTVLSGDLLPPFYQQLAEALPGTELRFYASPVTLEETITLGNAFPASYTVEGFTGWYQDSGLPENNTFSGKMRAGSREPNAFSALGWDTGLILNELVNRGLNGAQLHALPEGSFNEISGAKGTLRLDEESHHFIGDACLLKHTSAGGTELLQTINSEAGRGVMNEMITQKIEGMTSGWLNSYLCS
ncbi:ABC transporter substrate-binding protein [Flavihumibacter sp. R14]|nr:ABC transporter substrate-binding protein [Flavihumibacter soli]